MEAGQEKGMNKELSVQTENGNGAAQAAPSESIFYQALS
ncbi:hypothetical protein TH47_10895 [Thalassospira sp. MCCC 1A02803]|nr:hypothetical protein TH47_10895 [Thalassospira sp. MCCC 1A02803]